MTDEQKELWELPGWKLNKLRTATCAVAELWENLQIGAKATIRRDITGNIISCTISGM